MQRHARVAVLALVGAMFFGAGHARAEKEAALGKAPAANAKARAKVLALGQPLFTREWVPGDARSHGGDGLGPVYNERSCVACHHQGGTGGGGSPDKNIDIVTATGAGIPENGFFYSFAISYGTDGFRYQFSNNPNTRRNRGPNPAELARIHPGFAHSSSVVLHRYGPDFQYPSWRDTIPGVHGAVQVRLSQRNPAALFGAGLIDTIPDEVLEAQAKRRFPAGSPVRGNVSRLPDGRIGRFGWKAQTARLREFVLSAAAGELGLEVPGRAQAVDPRIPPLAAPGLDMTKDECDALTQYVASLSAPQVEPAAGPKEERTVKSGATLFRSIGCAQCHVPRLGNVDGIYSDLLLHDMGPDLIDTGFYSAFNADPAEKPAKPAAGRPREIGARLQEWRTPPLWGVRDSAPYLHDGRAETLGEAIKLHGGQGAFSAQRYAQLSGRDRQQVDAFLSTLAAPKPERP
jgi:CxxC motif-containing protein (DUF1111 family)